MNLLLTSTMSTLAPCRFSFARRRGWVAFLWLASVYALPAAVLDNFSGPKTGWTDTLNSGTIAQVGGQFNVRTAPASGALTYSKKTSSTFTNQNNHTLEFRVDINGVTPGDRDPNAQSILAWVPSGGAVLGSGYSLVQSAGSLSIRKGSSVLYTTNYATAGTNIQNTNITMVLRMTPNAGAVSVNARIYKRVAAGLIGQYFTVLAEYTVIDGSGLVGVGGNAALGVKNLAAAGGATVAFANLQVFEMNNTILDNFDNNPGLSGWNVFKKNPGLGDSVSVVNGQVDVLATIADASGGFAGVYSANTYKIIDGGRVEFQLDVVNNISGVNSYSALGYLPIATPQFIYGIVEYHVANDQTGHTVVVNGKGYNEWWGGRNDIQPPTTPPGARYTLTMTGEGANCRVETRIEDLSVTDLNAPARVVWQTEFIDTPAADPGLNEAANGNAFPYLNFDGRFCISTFNSGALPPAWAEIIFDNAVVNLTLPPVAAPKIQNISPDQGLNFLPDTTPVTFDVTDSTNVPLDQLSVTLNGTLYTNGSPGVAITPGGATSTSRHFVLSGALSPNLNYLGNIQARGPSGLLSTYALAFDTFLTNNYTVESEEYNFSTDSGTTGGSFFDSPLLIAEGTTQPGAYNGQPGTPEVDFHDNRGTCFSCGPSDANHTFRPFDLVYTARSGDLVRAKYTAAGGGAANFFEEEVEDIHDGDWLNYTHTYPAGTFNVFLRQAQFKIARSLVTLERVTGDRTQTNQTTASLGSFMGLPSGLGLFRNVPLTDGTGNPLVVRFSGAVDTLRVMNRTTGNADLDIGNLEQNYLVLIPAPNPGTLRPFVALVSPLPNISINSATPSITASLVNRDTTVNQGSIQLLANGIPLTVQKTATATGADLSATLSPLPPPDTVVTNTLIFQDSDGIFQTNNWTWTLSYQLLRAASALPLGSLKVRGFDVRMVQTDNSGVNLDNTLIRAEQQLAIPPEIAHDRAATSIVQVLNWNQNGSPTNVPGLCPAGEIKNIAVETLGYLELTAGLHRFHVVTDDRAGFYTGRSLKGPGMMTIWEAPDNTANTTFDFVVEAAGLYPLRCVWEQAGGGAVLNVTSVNLGDNSEIALNDPTDPPGVVKAWYPLACLASSTVTGPFTVEPTATCSLNTTDIICIDNGLPMNAMVVGGTVTVPAAQTARFYALDGPRATRITNISRAGSNIILTFVVP